MADRKMIFWFFLIVLVLASLMILRHRIAKPEHIAHPEWLTDFDGAKQIARQQHKDLLINFAGSDWCYWCKKLDAEVMTDADFVIPAQQDFVFVLIDFPANKSAQGQTLQQQNERLAQQYAIEGYPTIILAESDGTPYARTGYQPGGGKSYLDHLRQLRSDAGVQPVK
ncbi:MAG: thioredoxin family protein [Planctomycetaceae bacterium]|nr:thioredoxin family protein [Planctomycetaceae bacterium]